uniref:HEPN domain-containing protein n=1 Tax=Mesocestoides corti TaxID=53468 RepID=A0A5K3FUE5_MESCO
MRDKLKHIHQLLMKRLWATSDGKVVTLKSACEDAELAIRFAQFQLAATKYS